MFSNLIISLKNILFPGLNFPNSNKKVEEIKIIKINKLEYKIFLKSLIKKIARIMNNSIRKKGVLPAQYKLPKSKNQRKV